MDIEKYRSSLLRKHYSKKKSLIHLVIVSDLDFMKQYRLTLEKMEEYATKHNYSLTILNKDFFQEKNQSLMSCVYHKNFYFLKHCMIATYMGFPSFSSDDIFFVFDADVVPYRMEQGLEKWARLNETIIMYERGWSSEIMAGNYMIKNSEESRFFLRTWSQYEFMMPPGYSSFDNGAIHLHLLNVFNHQNDTLIGQCRKLYDALNLPMQNLSKYWEYVSCTRKDLPPGPYKYESLSFRLLPKGTAFVADDNVDVKDKNHYPGPVFHHFHWKSEFDQSGKPSQYHIRRYGLCC